MMVFKFLKFIPFCSVAEIDFLDEIVLQKEVKFSISSSLINFNFFDQHFSGNRGPESAKYPNDFTSPGC